MDRGKGELNKNNVAIHIIGWMVYLTLSPIVLANFVHLKVAFYIAAFTAVLHVTLFYTNAYFLVPKIYEKKRIALYVLLVLVLAMMITGVDAIVSKNIIRPQFLEEMHRRHLEDFGKDSPFPKGPPHPQGEDWLIPIMKNMSGLVIVFLASWLYVNKMKAGHRARQEAKLKNERLEAEMKFLKSQVNPHFLFNTLNNIYALSSTASPQAPEMIMKLSKMLRYNIYECNMSKVMLGQEITYIQNFINFQQLKTKHPQRIATNFERVDHVVEVSPLIFVPFVENSFKHSYIENGTTGWVSIYMETTENKILFKISNSIPSKLILKDALGGIGLENVKRRLELEYSSKHNLQIQHLDNEFSVTLELDR
jgi:two-component system, LytTR family, sensor kinase